MYRALGNILNANVTPLATMRQAGVAICACRVIPGNVLLFFGRRRLYTRNEHAVIAHQFQKPT